MSKKSVKSTEELLNEALVPEEEQPYKVPDNWVWVKLKSICNGTRRGIEPNQFPNEIFELYSVPSFALNAPEILSGQEISSNKQLVKENDVLICKINPKINRVWIVNKLSKYRQIGSTEWIVVPNNTQLHARYLMYFFRAPYFRSLLTANVSGVGGSLTRARPKDVENYPIALPPLNEQKRIAEKVERFLDKINLAKQLIEEAKETFEFRRAAILDKAFRGELTRKWRKENSSLKLNETPALKSNKHKPLTKDEIPYQIPQTWRWVRLGEIFRITSGGTPSRAIPEYYQGEIPWIKTGEIKWCELVDSEEKISEEAIKNSSAKLLPIDSVLVAMYGQGLTRGRAAILGIESACNQAVCALLPNENVDPKYTFFYFMEGYHRFRKIAQGGNQENLSASLISGFAFPLPPLEEQKVIVDYLANLFEIEENVQKLISLEESVDALTNSILKKAISGGFGTNVEEEVSAVTILLKNLNREN